MTHPVEASSLVERLRSDAAQLIRMAEATKFGDDLSVRVKAPDLLIGVLAEAADRIEQLERQSTPAPSTPVAEGVAIQALRLILKGYDADGNRVDVAMVAAEALDEIDTESKDKR